MKWLVGLVLDRVLRLVLEALVRVYNTHREQQEAKRRAQKAKVEYDRAKDEKGRRQAFEDAFNGACVDDDPSVCR